MNDTPAPADTTQSRPRLGVWLLFGILCIAAVAVFECRPAPISPGTDHPAVGSTLSQFEIVPLIDATREVRLADLDGHVVLVNYWGPWCHHCRREFPHLAALRQRYLDNPNVMVLFVSYGDGPVPEDLHELSDESRGFLEQLGIRTPVYADPRHVSLTGMERLVGQRGFPTTMVLDRGGVVRGLWAGFRDGEQHAMASLIDTLLAEN